ncbi:iron ABC transporter permease [Aeromicrobium sp.]|uniref:ABC transporter permease n=1 Tax=Aeromicrobium sp. TaxID=1871063 RepID=UPI0019C654F7|nr:iron ABC transporter permease [Aeromicrobium sp.]MBC7632645.1 iron ABC transporter permease [Aeromicrobium sp.]
MARRQGRRSAAPTSLLVVSAAVAAFALIPLGYLVVYATSLGGQEVWDLLVRPRMGELLWNTSRLVFGGCLLSLILGVSCAWVVERTDVPGRNLWHVLAAAPLAIPAFVNSSGWASLTPDAEGYIGALLIVTLSYFPLVYLPTAAMLRGLDPAMEEVARSLGLGPGGTFVRVVLPQLRPAMIGGALLVGLHMLSEFGALQMLRFPTFTTAIYDQYKSSFNSAGANVIAGVLVLCCLLLLMADLRLRSDPRLARVGSGAKRHASPVHLGGLRVPVLLLLVGLSAASLGVPIYSLIHWLVVGSSTAFPLGEILSAAGTSIGLGLLAALVTVVLSVPVAWLSVRFRTRTSTTIERSAYVANALPGIVVALALVTVSINYFPGIYQTYVLLIAAYAIMFLPRALVSVRSAAEQPPPVLEDVAHGLGLSRLATARRVTLPLLAPGIGAGGALVFLAVTTELTATLLLSPIGTSTLATEFWVNSSSVAYGAAAPYALLMVLISLPATYLLSQRPSSKVMT